MGGGQRLREVNLELRGQSLGFGVRALGFGIWVLGIYRFEGFRLWGCMPQRLAGSIHSGPARGVQHSPKSA